MNKNLKEVIMFGGCLIILLSLFSFLLDYGVKHSTGDQTGKINYIMNHELDREIVIFGSSVGEAGINAPIIKQMTGLETYNMALDGTRFMQYRGLINEFNSYSERCKYVILAETFFSFEKINALTSIERYLAFINKKNIYEPLYEIQPELTWKCRYVPFYKFVPVTDNYYKNSIKGWMNIFNSDRFFDKNEGFVPHYQTWQIDQDSINLKSKVINLSIDPQIVNKYSEVLKNINLKERKVIIVLPPIQKDAWRLINGLDKLRATLSSLVNDKVLFLDYSSSELSLDKNNFYNNLHLNNVGAELFAKQLAENILELMKKDSINGKRSLDTMIN